MLSGHFATGLNDGQQSRPVVSRARPGGVGSKLGDMHRRGMSMAVSPTYDQAT